ncbi:MAG: transketolase [Bacilli bacterium]
MTIENKSINTMRSLGLAMIDEAKSGHPGIVLGAAPIMYTLYSRHLHANVDDLFWVNRDRFIMAAGHGSALYYAMLHLVGYNLSIDDLKNFRQLKSKTPGHPEYLHTPGVDATSGPLGQGIAMGVGMAVAEEFLRKKNRVINHHTYVLCGDGDLQEGVTQEAISFAGVQQLGSLIVLYDSNDIQLDSEVSLVNKECTRTKYEAMNWQYLLVNDGNCVESIDEAINQAKSETSKPTIIEIKTRIGYKSKYEGQCAAHGAPFGVEDSVTAMNKLGYNLARFEVDEDVYFHFKDTFRERSINKYMVWNEHLDTMKREDEDTYVNLLNYISHNYECDFEGIYNKYRDYDKSASRVLGGKVLTEISYNMLNVFAGSADLSGSTKVIGNDGDFSMENREGRNLKFGVREHAMGAIANGIVLHSGFNAIVSGFFVFSDYLKPAIRMSALMNIPTIYTFTHDSIAVGEDGPTHEPVEQLIMLRSTPNIDVFRPADLKEVIASYKLALNKQNPSAIILSRQDLPNLEEYTSYGNATKGAYLVKSYENPDGIIISSGSELSLAIDVSDKLDESNIKYNVVSMLCMEIFNSQSKEYIDSILLPDCRKRVSIEMSSAYSYHQYVGLDGLIFSIDNFGLSGPAKDVINHFGFDKDSITYEIIKTCDRKGCE